LIVASVIVFRIGVRTGSELLVACGTIGIITAIATLLMSIAGSQRCPVCGAALHANSRFCESCGAQLRP
jgi:hypothetical protein